MTSGLLIVCLVSSGQIPLASRIIPGTETEDRMRRGQLPIQQLRDSIRCAELAPEQQRTFIPRMYPDVTLSALLATFAHLGGKTWGL